MCITAVDAMKNQLHARVDNLVDGYCTKFQDYHRSVDSLISRADEQFKRLEADHRALGMQVDHKDPLSRDIELMRLKKTAALKAEEILMRIKGDVDREKLLPRYQEFAKILNSEMPIYDDKSANEIYRLLAKDFDSNLHSRLESKNMQIVRDPYIFSSRPIETGQNGSIYSPYL